jgi:hypothetical protein
MKKQILEELNDIKYLFNYNRGKVISEQEQFEAEEIDFEEIDLDDEDINYLKGEFNEADMPSIAPSKPGIKTPTKPKKPGTPYSPKPGPKKNPKARKGDMPTWLSFDELGINLK